MFGTSLEEVMDMQKENFPDHHMPWVVQALVDAILQLHGPNSEGIFRSVFLTLDRIVMFVSTVVCWVAMH